MLGHRALSLKELVTLWNLCVQSRLRAETAGLSAFDATYRYLLKFALLDAEAAPHQKGDRAAERPELIAVKNEVDVSPPEHRPRDKIVRTRVSRSPNRERTEVQGGEQLSVETLKKR